MHLDFRLTGHRMTTHIGYMKIAEVRGGEHAGRGSMGYRHGADMSRVGCRAQGFESRGLVFRDSPSLVNLVHTVLATDFSLDLRFNFNFLTFVTVCV